MARSYHRHTLNLQDERRGSRGATSRQRCVDFEAALCIAVAGRQSTPPAEANRAEEAAARAKANAEAAVKERDDVATPLAGTADIKRRRSADDRSQSVRASQLECPCRA